MHPCCWKNHANCAREWHRARTSAKHRPWRSGSGGPMDMPVPGVSQATNSPISATTLASTGRRRSRENPSSIASSLKEVVSAPRLSSPADSAMALHTEPGNRAIALYSTPGHCLPRDALPRSFIEKIASYLNHLDYLRLRSASGSLRRTLPSLGEIRRTLPAPSKALAKRASHRLLHEKTHKAGSQLQTYPDLRPILKTMQVRWAMSWSLLECEFKYMLSGQFGCYGIPEVLAELQQHPVAKYAKS